jgi:hypothetical protein
MKPFQINIINAITLMAMGLWGYFSSETPSITALIPVFSGILLLVLTKGLKNANKLIAHVTVILTFAVLIALIKPLFGGFSRNDTAAIVRVLIMMLTCTLALIVFIKSFMDARKPRI